MRYGLLVLAVVAGIALHQGWLAMAYDHAANAGLTEDARLAIDVRCQGQADRAARECRSMLKRLYLAGSLDPDRTLRVYCDSVKTARWGGSRPTPPDVCVRRYGGWREG
jgi:hypothetical protein